MKTRSSKFHMTLLGERDVGKTAFAVKLLTGRYICDYDKGYDVPYQYHFLIDDESIEAQVFDASSPMTLSFKRFDFSKHETDLYVLMFSISEAKTFLYVRKFLEHLLALKEDGVEVEPIAVLANKADTSHFREVTTEDVIELLAQYSPSLTVKYFEEISVACTDVRIVFMDMFDWCRELDHHHAHQHHREQQQQRLLASSSSSSSNNNSNNGSQQSSRQESLDNEAEASSTVVVVTSSTNNAS